MIDIWRHESAPFILCQHFTYSVGTMVPPLLLGPFLTDRIENVTITNSSIVESMEASAELYIPFSVVAALIISGIVMHCGLGMAYKNRAIVYGVNSSAVEHLKDIPEDEGLSVLEDTLKRKICLVALACFIIGFYSALELCTSQFLPTFSNFSDVHLSQSEAAKVLFGLQLGFSIGRLVGIILVLRIAPQFLFVGNFTVILVSNIILSVLGGSSVTWLWIGSVSIGVGMSTVYPVLYAYIEKYIFVNTTVAGVITVAGGMVSSIYPLIVGNSVEKNPRILTYVNFVSIAVCTAAFFVLFWTTQARSKREKEFRGGTTIHFKSIPTE
ncbi:unnamed protein product [Allacma fusca]|uniref:Uncharacterized protein n=1 Tax=Allacma fusca TaxID=39272 RepID=A0A8J2LRM7_9HEXA|nr:unnamed protein product [Allacma fusca]